MRFKWTCSAVPLAMMSAGLANGQPVLLLDKPLYQTAAEFTSISAVRLFGDGSMLVADPGAREFVQVTARGSVRRVLGRHGSGPGEYESAQQLLAMPRGETVLLDPPQGRWMVFDSLGAFKRTIVLPPAMSDMRFAEFSDDRGDAYAVAFPPPPPAPAIAHIVRWSIATGRRDSLVTLTLAEMVELPLPKGPGGRVMGREFRFVPFAAQDSWTVLPAGGIAIVRAAGDAIEWIGPGGAAVRRTPLPPLPRVPVSDSARSAESNPAVRNRIPAFRPLSADSKLIAVTDGVVWMRRTRAPDEAFTEYLELSRERGVTRRIRLPRRSRIVGRRGNQIVVAQRDDDDLERLQVYVLSMPPR
jgi:hypothetical protein